MSIQLMPYNKCKYMKDRHTENARSAIWLCSAKWKKLHYLHLLPLERNNNILNLFWFGKLLINKIYTQRIVYVNQVFFKVLQMFFWIILLSSPKFRMYHLHYHSHPLHHELHSHCICHYRPVQNDMKNEEPRHFW